MTNTQMLIGSLSNDLLRVANLTHRGSHEGAKRFLTEAMRWSDQLRNKNTKPYIKKIIQDINLNNKKLTKDRAEDLLMYSTLLQNYSLKNRF